MSVKLEALFAISPAAQDVAVADHGSTLSAMARQGIPHLLLEITECLSVGEVCRSGEFAGCLTLRSNINSFCGVFSAFL